MATSPRSFNQGFFCAVASLVLMHGPSTEAKELLGMIGEVDLSTMAEEDVNVLHKAGMLDHQIMKKEATNEH